ncbi:MAG: quinone oxidoreductase [Betaproteobacteria bacterium RIFCSPLOWO2_02_FULL_62_17]|nr:MAG: quinone oxidoreductase [Betaproteobacteria bacterium RIFCSPLOWO2_02_FULL_62_17]
MSKAIRIYEPGDIDAMRWEEFAVGEPGRGEARVLHKAVGLNFVDVYQRSGLYKVPLPSGLGSEGAGVVDAVGQGVTLVKPGDRVAYYGGPLGSYSEVRNMPAERLILLPDAISFETGAAMMLKGLTVRSLLRAVHAVQPGDTILWHAAAGGVGLIACQWAKALGVTVIGTVGSETKAALAKAHGCEHVINYARENFVERVKEITGGKGVPVVYDSVGKDTFLGSLDCLKPRGLMVSFGNASGAVPPFDLALLVQRGSLYLTRPSAAHYVAQRPDLEVAAKELIDMVSSGKVKIDINQRYPLKDAGQAHLDLVARKTTGSTILIP